MSSQDRFGYEWEKYSEILPQHEGQFLMWIDPLTAQDFRGKTVLDAGCGMGRNSFWVCKYGAKKVVAFDYDKRSVDMARKNLSTFSQATVEYKSIYDIDYKNEFQVVFSIGVIHHLADPKKAIKKLYDSLAPGGKLLIWVYGDAHKIKIQIINLIRFITSKLPVGLTHFLTYFVSVPFYIYLKLFHQKSEYLKLLKTFSFFHFHAIAFDQIIPQIANYWNKEELEELFNVLPNDHQRQISLIKGYSWSILINKNINSHE